MILFPRIDCEVINSANHYRDLNKLIAIIMDVLRETLGISADFQAKAIIDQDDPYNIFCKEHNQIGTTANQKLSDDRNKLEHRREVLHNTIDNIIPPLKEYLNEFKNTLNEHTRDLDNIREKSTYLKTLLEYNSDKLKNISPLVNDLIIPPEVIQDILHGKIDQSWQENIDFIMDKQEIYKKYKDQGFDGLKPKDFNDLCDILDVLKLVILERSKKYIVFKIKSLRSNTPVPSQKLQYELMNVNKIFQFMVENNLSMALELRQAYAYTMKWYYSAYFGRYIRSLTILSFKNIDNHYVLGNGLSISPPGYANTNNSGYSFSSYLMPTSLSTATVSDDSINQYFQVERRLDLLTKEDNTVMVSQIAEHNQRENYLEIGFKNLNLAILDNCAAEFKFLSTFFKTNHNSEGELNGVLEQIFQPTFNQAIEYTKQLIQNTFDIFGILISIRITNLLQYSIIQKSLPSAIDDFFSVQLITLWPKFQQLIDIQCQNIRKLNITVRPGKNTGVADILSSPHELTVQFGKMIFSLLTLSVNHKENVDERSEPLYQSIPRLRNEFETVMTKISKTTKSPEKFLAVNYLYLYNLMQQQKLTHLTEESMLSPVVQQGTFDQQIGEQQSNNAVPLLIKETEDHFKSLVEAFNKE